MDSEPVAQGPPIEPSVGRLDAALLLAVVAGAWLTILGGSMLLLGSGALVPSGAGFETLPGILLAAGAATAGTVGVVRRHRLRRVLETSVPRLYPFATTRTQVAAYLLLLAGAAAVFASSFYSFASAFGSSSDAGVQNAGAMDLLFVLGSFVIWLIVLYTVLVLYRFIRIGHAVELLEGRDIYRASEPGTDTADGVEPVAMPPLPEPEFGRSLLFPMTIICLLGISALIQLLVNAAAPVAASDWAWAQLLLLMWGALVAAGIGLIDRAIRNLERDYLRARREASPDRRALPSG